MPAIDLAATGRANGGPFTATYTAVPTAYPA
jgi:hypothetical protein